jgi:hypothetical protein
MYIAYLNFSGLKPLIFYEFYIYFHLLLEHAFAVIALVFLMDGWLDAGLTSDPSACNTTAANPDDLVSIMRLLYLEIFLHRHYYLRYYLGLVDCGPRLVR